MELSLSFCFNISYRNRETAKRLIQRYFQQLTVGCGNSSCTNESCASHSDFQPLDKNTAAAKALELFKVNAKLCDYYPVVKSSSDESLEMGGKMSVDEFSGNLKRTLSLEEAELRPVL